jgi:rSAM/selenodomain-associated transferase 2
VKNPIISVIIPVLHEESSINTVIDHVKIISSGIGVEIIVVDGDIGGSTLAALADAGTIRVTSDPGRAEQMNRGSERASGDILLFLHADTVLPSNAFSLIIDAARTGLYAAGAFGLGLDSSRLPIRLIGAAARLRIRITGIPFGDQAIFIMRNYFRRIGGYAPIPLMEDVEIMKRIRKRGDRIIILPGRVATSARKWEKEGILFSIFRNWFIQFAYFCGAAPEWLAQLYYRRHDS